MEYFTVYRRIASHPPVYKVADLDGEIVKGNFYEAEMQKSHSLPTCIALKKSLVVAGREKKDKYG